MSEGGGTTIERLQVIIEATTGPYKKQMEEIRKATKEATKDVDRETAKIKKALQKIREIRLKAFQMKDSSDGNQNKPELQTENQNKVSRIRAMNEQIRDITKQANLQAGTTVQTNGYAQLQKDIQKTETSLDSLRRKQEAMKQSGVYEQAKEYSELSACIAKTENKLNGLLAKEEMMKQQGVKTSSTGWKNLQYNIEETKNTLNAYKQDIAGLEADGNSSVLAKEWDKTQLAIQKAEAELARYKQQKMMMAANGEDVGYKNPSRWSNGSQIESGVNMAKMGMNQLNGSVDRVKSNIKNFLLSIPGIGGAIRNTAYVGSKAFEGMKKVLKSTGNTIKKVSGAFGALLHKFKNGLPHFRKNKDSMGDLNNSANRLSKGIFRLGNMFKLMLLRMAMRAVTQGGAEGFQNLAMYSNQTNRSLSMLMSSMTQLKNSFATAFAPLLSAVAPILDAFIQKVISAITAIGQFFAALTGQKTFTIAKKVHQDYAKSLNKTGDSAKKNAKKAKEAEGELMGFDRINNMSKNKGNDSDSGGGAGGLSPSDMFDTVEIDSKYKDLANKVKGYFQQIFEPMKKAWDTYGQSVMNAWNRALKSVWELVKSIAKSFLEVWTNGTGKEFCGNILKSLRLILNIIGDIAIAFKNAWDDKGRGTKFIQSIFDMLNAIMDLLLEIGESMRTVWNSGSGESIIANLLDGFRHINNTITNISDNFKKAWKLDNTGTKILQDLTDIFDNLLDYIRKITKNLEKWSKNLDFSPLLKSLQGITEALKPLGDKVGGGLEWLFKHVLQPLAKWAIEQAIPAALDAIKEALRFLDVILEKLKPVGKWLWENFLQPLGKWTGDVTIKAIKGIGTVFKDLADIIEDATDWKDALVKIGKCLIDGLKKGIKVAISAIGRWIKTYMVDPIVKKVKNFFGIHSPSTVFKQIGKYLIDGLVEGIKQAPNAMLDALKGIWDNAKKWWSENVKLPKLDMPEIGEIKTTFVAIKDKSFDIVAEAINSIKENFKDKKARFTATTNTAFGKVKETIADIASSFKDRTAYYNLKIKGKLEELGETIVAFKDKTAVFKAKIGEGVKFVRDTILNIKKYFVDKTAKYNAKIGNGFKKVKEAIENVKENFTDKTATFKAIVDKTFDKVKDTVEDIKEYFVNRTAKYKAELVGKWETLKNTVSNIKENFKSKTASFRASVVTKWGDIHEKWKRLSGAFKDKKAEFSVKLKTVVGSVRNFVNSLITAVNNHLIAKLDFSFKTPSWLGGKTWGWKAPRIRFFAKGGFPDTGQMFIAREAGPELVGNIGSRTAVANNNQIVTAVAQGVASAVNAVLVPAIQNGQNVYVSLQGDAKNLFKVMQQENRSCKIRTGRYGFST